MDHKQQSCRACEHFIVPLARESIVGASLWGPHLLCGASSPSQIDRCAPRHLRPYVGLSFEAAGVPRFPGGGAAAANGCDISEHEGQGSGPQEFEFRAI
eukprot:6250774-Amphidinium_carterae.1